MRIKRLFVVSMMSCLFTLSFSENVYSYCEGVQLIEIDPINDFGARQKFMDVLANYDDPKYVTNGRFELCFDFKSPLNVIIHPNHFITFPDHAPAKNLEVVISGVKLNRSATETDPVFMVKEYMQKVVIENLEITNVSNGLKIYKTQSEVVNPIIHGVPGGSCIDLVMADNSIIKGGVIEGCDVGVSIEGTVNTLIGASDAEHYEADKNVITNNGIGIHVLKGMYIKFGYNANYGNMKISPSYENAIVISEGSNEDVLVPQLMRFDYEGALVALKCERDESGKITKRMLKFDNPPGNIQLYAADLGSSQAEQFIADCAIAEDGICDCALLPEWVPIDETKCGISEGVQFYITAIYTNNSSSSLMQPEALDGVDVLFVGSGGFVQTTPSSEATDEVPIEETSGAGSSGEGGGVEALAPSIASGCGGGASLIPNDVFSTFAPSLGIWWIIFGVGLITGIRVQMSRIRNHRRHR